MMMMIKNFFQRIVFLNFLKPPIKIITFSLKFSVFRIAAPLQDHPP